MDRCAPSVLWSSADASTAWTGWGQWLSPSSPTADTPGSEHGLARKNLPAPCRADIGSRLDKMSSTQFCLITNVVANKSKMVTVEASPGGEMAPEHLVTPVADPINGQQTRSEYDEGLSNLSAYIWETTEWWTS